MVGMAVGEEDVFELEFVLLDQGEDRSRVEPGVEERGLAVDLVPHEVGVDRHAFALGRDLPDLAPLSEVGGSRLPTLHQTFQLGCIQLNELAERDEVDRLGQCAGRFEVGQFGNGQSGSLGGCFGRGVDGQAGLANDIAGVVFEIHGAGR